VSFIEGTDGVGNFFFSEGEFVGTFSGLSFEESVMSVLFFGDGGDVVVE